MCRAFSHVFLLIGFCVIPLVVVVGSECKRKPVLFIYGDSNSDTGGYDAAMGTEAGYPYGRTFFHQQPTGRISDGRLVLDFLCESLNTNYLSPYLRSLQHNFTNGVNFAIGGASTLRRGKPFTLGIQVQQFRRFRNHSIQLHSKKLPGFENVVGEEDFKNALHVIDIGQNDLASASSYAEVIQKIPLVIYEIRDAISTIYKLGGMNFWVHNTGPLGCLPGILATRKPNATDDFDENGCIKSVNDGAKAFNAMLNALVQELRVDMENSTIIHVDMYSIKYDLIANSVSYGFENPLMACCGHGGPPYNFDRKIGCGISGYTACEVWGRPYVNWDGFHYTEAANAIIASKILSTNYSTPQVEFSSFCNT